MENNQQALSMIRRLSDDFVAGHIPFDEFYAQLHQLLGTFDPLDEALEEFDSGTQKGIEFYFRYIGGEFGDQEDFIPRTRSWTYGESKEPYGWIDHKKFLKMYARDYRKFRRV